MVHLKFIGYAIMLNLTLADGQEKLTHGARKRSHLRGKRIA